MERKIYIVTDTAGERVAGGRVVHGQSLSLTEAEARHELLAGTVRRPTPGELEPVGDDGTADAEWSDAVLDAAEPAPAHASARRKARK